MNVSTSIRQKKYVNYETTRMNDLDLNIENYSFVDLCNLFNITDNNLNDDNLKQAKKILYMIHPDKSKLDPKFFLFFSKAYNILKQVNEFQNKSSNKKTSDVYNSNNYSNEDVSNILINFFKNNPELNNNPQHFNKWFNENFEKYGVDNSQNKGYGEWLKSHDTNFEETENGTAITLFK